MLTPSCGSAASASRQPVGAQDGGEKSAGNSALQAKLQPVAQLAAVAQGAGRGRHRARPGPRHERADCRRHGRNPASGPAAGRRYRPRRKRACHAIGARHCALASAARLGIDLDPGQGQARHPRRQAQAGRARPRPQFQRAVAGPGRNGGRQHHRIQAGAEARARAGVPDPAIQKCLAHICPASDPARLRAAAVSARAKSSSSTISRRGRKPMLPSMTLAWVSNTTDLMPSCDRTLAAIIQDHRIDGFQDHAHGILIAKPRPSVPLGGGAGVRYPVGRMGGQETQVLRRRRRDFPGGAAACPGRRRHGRDRPADPHPHGLRRGADPGPGAST